MWRIIIILLFLSGCCSQNKTYLTSIEREKVFQRNG